MKVKALAKAAKTILITHGPQIATGVGIALAFVAGITAVKETPKALEKIEEKKEELGKDDLTVKETVEATWKCYALPVLIFLLAAITIICGQNVSTRRAAAIATAYSLSEETLKEYTETAKTVVGEKKEKEIRDQAAKQAIEKNPPMNSDDIISTGRGNHLCYDLLSKRYFWSDIDRVKRVIGDLNDKLRVEMFVSLNEYWQALAPNEIPTTDPGRKLGWHIDDGYIEPDYTYGPVESGPYEGVPCLIISFYESNLPDYAFKA